MSPEFREYLMQLKAEGAQIRDNIHKASTIESFLEHISKDTTKITGTTELDPGAFELIRSQSRDWQEMINFLMFVGAQRFAALGDMVASANNEVTKNKIPVEEWTPEMIKQHDEKVAGIQAMMAQQGIIVESGPPEPQQSQGPQQVLESVKVEISIYKFVMDSHLIMRTLYRQYGKIVCVNLDEELKLNGLASD